MTDRETAVIYHVFVDRGIESEALSGYGRVVRVGLDPSDENESEPIKADAQQLPLRPGADLAVLHPPCTRWSDMTSISGNPDDHPDLIPLARDIGREYAEHYIIENKPAAPLRDPVTLDGRMFGLPLAFRRSFETSFSVPSIPFQQTLDNECSPYFYSERSRAWWAGVKGYRGDRYTKTALARNCVPAAYIHHLMRAWLRSTNETDAKEVAGHATV
jgi:hypothetical protein